MSNFTNKERKMINALNKRVEHLERRIANNKATGQPTSFDEVEVQAITWALEYVERWFNGNQEEYR